MWLLVAVAHAWAPHEPVVVTLPAKPIDLQVLEGPQGPTVLALDGEHLFALQDDAIVARLDHPAHALVVADLDGADGEELLLCADEGLFSVPWAGRSFGAPIRVDEAPCQAAVVQTTELGQQVVATGRDGTLRIGLHAGGIQATTIDLRVDGEPLLEATSTSVALGARNGRNLLLHDGAGGALLPVGGPLVAVASVGDDLLWVQAEAPDHVHHGARTYDLGRPIDGLAALSAVPEGWVAWSAEGWTSHPWDVPAGPPTVAHLDGDDCLDLLVAVDDGYVRAMGTCDDGPATARVEPPPTPAAPTPTAPEDDDDWPPRAWTRGDRVPVSDLPPPPDELVLAERPTLLVFVDQELDIRLVAEGGQVDKLAGQPPGANVQGSHLLYTPEAWDIGHWQVAARVGPGRWHTFDLEVWPRPAPGHPVPTVAAVAPEAAPPDAPIVGDKWYHLDRCALGIGAAGGASRSGGLVWEDLGNPSVLPSGSPAVGVVCTGGGSLQWVLGLDSAPWFRYTDLPLDRSHLIGATAGLQFGTDRVGVGPYGSAGVTAVNVGLRGQGFVSDRFGVELRAGWLAPRAGVEGLAFLLYRVGRASRP